MGMNNKIDISKLRLPNGRTLQQQMQYEAQRFLSILKEEILIWYHKYEPTIYQRSYEMLDSLYVENFVDVNPNGTQLTISIKYKDAAFHQSLWSGENVNALYLMNDGYQVSSGWHKIIENFGYRKGGNFFESAIERFNRDNYFGVEVKLVR